jgi:hypothetical protein
MKGFLAFVIIQLRSSDGDAITYRIPCVGSAPQSLATNLSPSPLTISLMNTHTTHTHY